jgi:Tol biopolymer transport system component
VTPVTSDADFYFDSSVSADGATIAAVRGRQEANLWVASPSGTRSVRQITFGSGEEGAVRTFDPAQDSTIHFEAIKEGSAQIFAIGADGAGERSLTSGRRLAVNPYYRPGVGIIYVQSEEDLTPHVWRSDEDGENPRQLTSGKGERIVDVSPDGRVVLFQRDDVLNVLWSVSSEGGESSRLGVSSRFSALFSPDGSRILHVFVHEIQGLGAFTPQIMPAKGGEPVVTPALPPRTFDEAWTPDGKGLTYLHESNELRNLFRLRLDGGTPEEITRFTEGRIQAHRWSPDGKRLLVQSRKENADNLWVVNAEGSNPIAVTDFETGAIGDMKWSRDGSSIYFTYGATSQNVVLIRNLR